MIMVRGERNQLPLTRSPTVLFPAVYSRLDYQPLFGKGDRAPPPKAEGEGTTRESGGNLA